MSVLITLALLTLTDVFGSLYAFLLTLTETLRSEPWTVFTLLDAFFKISAAITLPDTT